MSSKKKQAQVEKPTLQETLVSLLKQGPVTVKQVQALLQLRGFRERSNGAISAALRDLRKGPHFYNVTATRNGRAWTYNLTLTTTAAAAFPEASA